MKKTALKRLGAVLLTLVMICGCMSVWAEETTYNYTDISKTETTTIKVWRTSVDENEMSGCTPGSGEGETFVGINYGNYVVFRVNVLAGGIYDLAIGFGAGTEGNKAFSVTVDEQETKNVSPTYSGEGIYVADYQAATTLTLSKGQHEIKLTSTGASGNLMGIKLTCIERDLLETLEMFPCITLEAEDFTESGYYSSGNIKDEGEESSVEVGTTDSGVTYVEFDNLDYIRIPFTPSSNGNYRFYIVYASTSGAALNVAGKFDARLSSTESLTNFTAYDMAQKHYFYATGQTAYVRPLGMAEGGKIRIDKIIMQLAGTEVPSDGGVAVTKANSAYEKSGNNITMESGVGGNPIYLAKDSYAKFTLDFPKSGYYNIQLLAASAYSGNNAYYDLTIDDEKVLSKINIANVKQGYSSETPLDLGALYIEEGTHIFIFTGTNNNSNRFYEFAVQKTDTTDGLVALAKDSTDYSENVTPSVATKLAAGEDITFAMTVDEDGYYSLKGMFSTAGAAASVSVTLDDGEAVGYTIGGTSKWNTLKQENVDDFYLTAGTHKIKIAAVSDVYINSVRLYAPKVEYTGLSAGNSQATVNLNGLFSSKAVDCIIGVYKGNQLYKVDYDNVAVAQNGSEFTLSLSDIEFEEGITYKAKLFVWSNMAGECYEYSAK